LKLIRWRSPPKITINSPTIEAECPSLAHGLLLYSFTYIIGITFINEAKLSLFLFKLEPKDLIEFLSASVVGELISKFYFYSSES
jgi:hypothetical protein